MDHRPRSQPKLSSFVVAIFSLYILTPAALAEPFFKDGFESADLNHSANGFRWTSSNRVSIVRDDQYRVWVSGNQVEDGPYDGRDWENAPDSAGRHAMRFNYTAGTPHSEQRFSLGGAYTEIWASWWLRVPVNFQHTGRNNKLFMFWQDAYSAKGDGSTVGMEFRESRDEPGGSRWYVKVSAGRYNSVGSDQASAPFISYPSDQGRWMQIIVKIKAESEEDAGDGTVQVWRRWADESKFEQTHNLAGQPIRIPASGPKGFSAGYLMGWANDAYLVDTEFLLDDFSVSASSLLDVGVSPKPPLSINVD